LSIDLSFEILDYRLFGRWS